MISETDRKKIRQKINKIFKKNEYLQNEHTQLMYTDIDYDGQPFYKQDNLNRISMKIDNLKQQVARMYVTYDK